MQSPETKAPSSTPSMHPSGLTIERWQWPFKTLQERQLVAAYFKKLQETQPNFEQALL